MKNIILLLFIFQVSFISCQTKENLYLFFKNKKDKMYLYPYKNGVFDIYIYNVYIDFKGTAPEYQGKKYYSEIYFDSQTADMNGARTELIQKTKNLKQLKKLDVKDFKWLEKKIGSFTSFQSLYQFYDKMYIVQVDSINKKAILTEVNNVEIVD